MSPDYLSSRGCTNYNFTKHTVKMYSKGNNYHLLSFEDILHSKVFKKISLGLVNLYTPEFSRSFTFIYHKIYFYKLWGRYVWVNSVWKNLYITNNLYLHVFIFQPWNSTMELANDIFKNVFFKVTYF